jgi:hypothetical protein
VRVAQEARFYAGCQILSKLQKDCIKYILSSRCLERRANPLKFIFQSIFYFLISMTRYRRPLLFWTGSLLVLVLGSAIAITTLPQPERYKLAEKFFGKKLLAKGETLFVEKENEENEEKENEENEEHERLESLAKQNWWKNIFRAAPGVDAEAIIQSSEALIAATRQQEPARKKDSKSLQAVETLPGGLMGEWFERGSTRFAGQVHNTALDDASGKIYALTETGVLFHGTLNSTNTAVPEWTVTPRRVSTTLLKVVPTTSGLGRRLFISSGGLLNYSDDDGMTWNVPTYTGTTWTGGTTIQSPHSVYNFVVNLATLNDANKTMYMLYRRKTSAATTSGAGSGSYDLYRSTNRGTSFTLVQSFSADFMGQKRCYLWSPNKNINETYLIDESPTTGVIQLYEITPTAVTPLRTMSGLPSLQNLTSFDRGVIASFDIFKDNSNTNSNFTIYYGFCREMNNTYTTYHYRSDDGGATFVQSSTPPASYNTAAYLGLCASANAPNTVFGGYFQGGGFRSTNKGTSYTNLPSGFNHNNDMLHVDIRSLVTVRRSNGTSLLFVGDDSGLHVSSDEGQTFKYLCYTGTPNGMNSAAYYSVATHPSSPNVMFTGAQDHGLFATFNANATTKEPFENFFVTSDGGQTMYTGANAPGGAGLWFQGVRGNLSMMLNSSKATSTVINGLLTLGGFTNFFAGGLNGPLPSGFWYRAIAPTPFSSVRNEIYTSTGNGSTTSTLTKCVAGTTGITSAPLAYNFSANSNSRNSVICAIGTTPADPNRCYVLTEDGTFFTSKNLQSTAPTFTKSPTSPGKTEPYFYGTRILTSSTNADVVYICGSGFSNPPVYRSTDGGQTITSASVGLPQLTVISMCFSPDESMIFAATVIGPYYLNLRTGQWHSLRGMSAPLATFTWVEYVPASNTMRFATYGRGVWDLRLNPSTPPPTISSFAPASASIGAHVTITGSNFTGATAVRIGNVNVPQFTVIDPTTIRFTVPAGVQAATVTVVTPGGTATSTLPFMAVISSVRANVQELAGNVFPNPATHTLTVETTLPSPQNLTVALYDVTGKVLIRQTHFSNAGRFSTSLDVNSLPRGTYILRLATNDGKHQFSRTVTKQ